MTTAVLALAASVLVVVGALLSGWLLIGWFGAWRLNRRPFRHPDPTFTLTPWELGVDYKEVGFETPDGITLRGWFLPRPGTRRAIVALHGYRGNMAQLLGISTALWRSGFNVLLFDFRGRGRSQPSPISMGLWEREDLTAALDLLADHIPEPRVGLLGYSMGAAVAVFGGGDRRVDALVLDSCFASLRDILEQMAMNESRRYLRGWVDGRWFLPAMEWFHRRAGKPSFAAAIPEHAIDKLGGKPVLVIHGERDITVPVTQAERLAERAGAELWRVKGAHHCGAYFVDREAYSTRVAAFFHRHLGERKAGTAAAEWRSK